MRHPEAGCLNQSWGIRASFLEEERSKLTPEGGARQGEERRSKQNHNIHKVASQRQEVTSLKSGVYGAMESGVSLVTVTSQTDSFHTTNLALLSKNCLTVYSKK